MTSPALTSLQSRALTRKDRTAEYQRFAWYTVLFGLVVIACESTKTMGSGHTGQWIIELVGLFHKRLTGPTLELTNHILRKSGHFLGYGTLGVIFCRAWTAQLNRFAILTWRSVHLRGAALGVLSACLIACADEVHQSFLPGRTATVTDVLLDTTGALLMNAIVFAVLAGRRRNLAQDLSHLRALGLQTRRALRQTSRQAADSLRLAA